MAYASVIDVFRSHPDYAAPEMLEAIRAISPADADP